MIGVVLAAGMSSRFGQSKLSYVLNDKPLIHYVLDSLYQFMEVSVIVGHYENEIRSALPDYVSQIIKNNKYQLGIGSSVQLAIDLARSKKEDLLLTLGDLIYVNSKDYKKLINNFKGETLYSSFSGTYGPPCIIPFHVLNDMKGLPEKAGLKGMIKNFHTIFIENAKRDVDFLSNIHMV